MRWAITIVLILMVGSIGDLGISVEDQDNTLKNVSAIFASVDDIRVDGNGDGDVNDTDKKDDYVKYNRVYLSSTFPQVVLYPVYLIWDPAALVQRIDSYPGGFITINGVDYLVVDADDYSLVMGIPVKKKIDLLSEFQPYYAISYLSDKKLNLALGPTWKLMIVSNGSIIGGIDVGSIPDGTEITTKMEEITTTISDYRIFLTDKGANWVEISAVKKASLLTIQDDDTDVFGYSKLKINSNMPSGSGSIMFMGQPLELDREMDTMRLDFPRYYRFNYDYIKKRLWGTMGVIPKNVTLQEEKEEDTTPKEWRGINITKWDGKILNLSDFRPATDNILVDANGDGDLDESDQDHIIFNQILVKDANNFELGLIYTIAPEYKVLPNIADLQGSAIKIAGKEYLVTYVFENAVKLGVDPLKIRVQAQSEFTVDKVSYVIDGIGFGLTYANSLYFVRNGTVMGVTDLEGVPEGADLSSKLKEATDALEDYRVFLSKKDSYHMEFTLIKRSLEMEVVDGQRNIFDYDLVKVNSPEVPEGEGRIHFFGSEYNLTMFGVAEVEEAPYYQFEVNSLGELRIKLMSVPIKNSTPDEEGSDETDGGSGSLEHEILKPPVHDLDGMENETNITKDTPEMITIESPLPKAGVCGPGVILLLALLPLAFIPRTRRGRWRS